MVLYLLLQWYSTVLIIVVFEYSEFEYSTIQYSTSVFERYGAFVCRPGQQYINCDLNIMDINVKFLSIIIIYIINVFI